MKKSTRDESPLPAMSALKYEDSESDKEAEEEEEDEDEEDEEEQPEEAVKDDGEMEKQTDTSGPNNFPTLKGFLPPVQVVAQPRLYSKEEEEREERLAEEERAKTAENNAKLRDKLAAAAREKMVQVEDSCAIEQLKFRKFNCTY